jgi:hypothetical protein
LVDVLVCVVCGESFPIWVEIDGKRHNFQNRKRCLNCSPFKEHNTTRVTSIPGDKDCVLCGRPSKRRNLCFSCNTRIRRARVKLAAVNYKGGKCNRCGWDKHYTAFHFHHTNPSDKDFCIGRATNRQWAVVKAELDKCELLCANCHTLEHSDRDDKHFIEVLMNYEGELLDLTPLE